MTEKKSENLTNPDSTKKRRMPIQLIIRIPPPTPPNAMRNILTLILCLLAAMPAQAELTSGIYRLKRPLYGRYMYEDLASGGICTDTKAEDTAYHKLWKVTVDGNCRRSPGPCETDTD